MVNKKKVAEKKTEQKTTQIKGTRIRGVVVSDKMDKTIVVKVDRLVRHPLYQKTYRRSKKIKAHDPENKAKIGDLVEIVSSRPFSKEKHFCLLKIIKEKLS
ncbi:30S ribosomal protein S17 [bacterium]|nr:30S ribosomal protein S17 [bacterium]